jgi:hypothetical protein
MALAPSSPSIPVYRERVVSIQRQSDPAACVFPNQTKLLLSRILAPYVAIGDEITFPIPSPDATGAEIYITKNGSSGINRFLYQAPIGYVSQPKRDKRNQHFVSAEVQPKNLGIATIVLQCQVLREYFYRLPRTADRVDHPTLDSCRGLGQAAGGCSRRQRNARPLAASRHLLKCGPRSWRTKLDAPGQ